jgi:hypothetical protein
MQFTKISKDGAIRTIESHKLQRFLDAGWIQIPAEEKKVTKSKSSKNKITADAQVTSKEPSEEEVVEIEEDEDPDAMDTLTFSYDDFETAKKED